MTKVANLRIFATRALTGVKLFARFRRDERGVTAVEFGLVALPFIGLLLATLETAVLYYAGQSLENAVADSARLIRTGQAQQQAMSADQFKQTICDQTGAMFDCTSGLKLDVKTFATFDSIDLKPPVDAKGDLMTTFSFAMGKGGE